MNDKKGEVVKMKHRKCRIMAIFSVMLILLSSFPVQAEEEVQHSTVDYELSFREAGGIFIGNEIPVDWKVGDKYFLHYTVTEVSEDHTNQWGMLTTKNPTDSYPYETGAMRYTDEVSVCEKGWTYLFRFEVTEDGFDVLAGKANQDGSSYIQFPYVTGDAAAKTPYFGVWITGTNGESMTAELRNIRCYDASGKDLGVSSPKASEIRISEMNTLDVNHSYSFSVEEVPVLAFGNEKRSEADVILLEYTVSNVDATDVSQSGAELTNAPTAHYPHGDNMGQLQFAFHNETDGETKLLSEGARYLVRFERGDGKFSVLVKRTMPNSAVDYFSFPNVAGDYNDIFGHAMMWFGEYAKLTADFTDVKCYDEQGNNLGITTNRGVAITHHGELEDYSQCLAVYYCKENDTLIVLEDEQKARKVANSTGETEQGTYSIESGVLRLVTDETEENFEYGYEFFRDDEGNRYVRLKSVKVTFMSRKYEGEVLSQTMTDAAGGYRAQKPEDPVSEGRTFQGWVDGTGKEYDFEQIATESITLYATWDDEAEYQEVNGKGSGWLSDGMLVVMICSLLVIGTGIASVLYVRKRK